MPARTAAGSRPRASAHSRHASSPAAFESTSTPSLSNRSADALPAGVVHVPAAPSSALGGRLGVRAITLAILPGPARLAVVAVAVAVVVAVAGRARRLRQDGAMANTDARPWVKNYQPGVPAEIDLPTDSLVAMFERSVAEAGSHPALEFFGRRTSYSELGDQVDRVAEGLRQLGVRPGDRVALVFPNCPQHVVAFYAVLRLGAVVVEHNPLYTSRELRHQFEDHQARIVVAWDKIVPALRDFPSDVEIDHIVSVNLLHAFPSAKRLALRLPVPRLRAARKALTASAPDTIPWKHLLNRGRIDPAHPRPTVHDLAAIQYTSGTTSQPKGAMLTHFNLVSNALQG